MSDAPYFDEDALIEGEADQAVHEMARRQFGVSLAVGVALLAIAGLMAMETARQAPADAQMTARHRIIVPAAAPQTETAQPVQHTLTKG